MDASPPPPRSTPPGTSAAADLLEQFEKAWQGGLPPRLRDFLLLVKPADATRPTLIELVMIDLDQRWRRANTPGIAFSDPLGVTPKLEAYVAHYPELGRLDRLPIELIRQEFWVRSWWGDRPETEEYALRFPQQGQRLIEELENARREITTDAPTTANHPGRSIPDALPVDQPSPVKSPAEFISAVLAHQLLSPGQARQLPTLGHHSSVNLLAQELIQRDWLTPYQINHLVRGTTDLLTIGSYFLLEKIGEGGTGTVFKARHRHMNRLAAVKVLRQELVADAEVLARFYREMQVFNRLSHPHVIRAYDAGPAGQAHMLVMEYAPGVDLSRLVKTSGPLRPEQAIEYIRQAALGLQHIHEHGLVHRDIKPSNFLVCGLPGNPADMNTPIDTTLHPVGSLKILDLGLARLRRMASGLPAHTSLTEEWTATLTPLGAACMGTPDYLAPEQAMDFHSADARADLYSLGCTLFFLLTGRPPFPGGSIAQKLMQHQNTLPENVCQVRADVPHWVGSIVGRLLEKDPSRRFQSATDLLQALANDPSRVSTAVPVQRIATLPRRPKAQKWIVAGLCTVLLGGLAVGWAAFLTHRPTPIAITSSTHPIGQENRPRTTLVTLPEVPAAYLCDFEEVASSIWNSRFGKKGELGYEQGKIKVKGELSPHGISFHPPEEGNAWVAYRLGKRYRTLVGTVAINDTVKASHVPLSFEIFGDDRLLWKSRPHKEREDPEDYRVDISGVDLLKMEVLCPGLHHGAHAVWLEPRLFVVPPTGIAAPTPPSHP